MGAPVRVGDLLAEKYEVTRILGMGGMGVVVAARHRELDKLVALKFMHEEVAANEQAIERFLREARAAARLQNEHVGHVLDVGRLPGGVPYIVMEYLEGSDLAHVIEQRGPLDASEAVEYILQACEAMAEAHALGIIHRDLKPENLFITMRPDGRPLVKVLDFGISKAQFAKGPTATHQTMGSPAYMSPEQMRSTRSVDPRADIWSLGVILYQLLVGSLPFAGETIAEMMLRVISDPTPSLAAARPDLPPGLVAAVERCLEKDRAKRFNNVAEFAHELMLFAPERARAALSLVERVLSTGLSQQPQQPRHGSDDDLDSVVPNVETAAPAEPRRPAPHSQTTLGTAASSLDVEPRPPVRWRWMGASLLGIAVVVAIPMFAMRGGGSSNPVPAPADAAIIVMDATQMEADATVPMAPVDALPDAPVDALAQFVDAGRRTTDARNRVSIDAAISTPIDAATDAVPPDAFILVPARPPDSGLLPAREQTK